MVADFSAVKHGSLHLGFCSSGHPDHDLSSLIRIRFPGSTSLGRSLYETDTHSFVPSVSLVVMVNVCPFSRYSSPLINSLFGFPVPGYPTARLPVRPTRLLRCGKALSFLHVLHDCRGKNLSAPRSFLPSACFAVFLCPSTPDRSCIQFLFFA